jgi:hypothetical protein
MIQQAGPANALLLRRKLQIHSTRGQSSRQRVYTERGYRMEVCRSGRAVLTGDSNAILGGHHACPGRLLAKRIMLMTVIALVQSYDIELLSADKPPTFASPRFGFGVRKLAQQTPFRIRERFISSEGISQ